MVTLRLNYPFVRLLYCSTLKYIYISMGVLAFETPLVIWLNVYRVTLPFATSGSHIDGFSQTSNPCKHYHECAQNTVGSLYSHVLGLVKAVPPPEIMAAFTKTPMVITRLTW